MIIYLQLAWSFFKIGCLTIGGGYAMLPLIQNEIERHAWLTGDQFLDILAIAEMTPGPLAVNTATFVGYRTGGIAGALLATAALALPSLAGMLALSAGWRHYRRHMLTISILGVLRPVVAGLIAGAGIKVAAAVPASLALTNDLLLQLLIALAAFGCIWRSKINPALVMLGAGMVGALIF